MIRLVACLCLADLVACGDEPKTAPSLRFARTGLVMGTTYETSTVDAFDLDNPARMHRNLIVADGDATLVRAGERAVVINRGYASNVQLLEADLTPGPQVALPGCGPHDAVELADGRFLISCYDHHQMMVVDFGANNFKMGPDLSGFADADGLPDMDQMVRAGERIYLTLQRLDQKSYASLGNGRVAVIDANSLTLIDTDLNTAGLQAFDLALANPYTRLGRTADGRLMVGCAGDWMTAETLGVAVLDPLTGQSTVLTNGSSLGGAPSELDLGPDGILWALVAAPNGLIVDEMRVVRFEGTSAVTASSAGFTLAGLAVGTDGTVYFGNRTEGAAAGLYVATPTAQTLAGPFLTSLPPFAIILLD